MTLSEIQIVSLQEQPTACVRRKMRPSQLGDIPELIGRTFEAVQAAGMEPAGMPYTRVHSMSVFGMDVEVGWPLAAPFPGSGDVGAGVLPGGPAAVASYFGPYEEIGPAHEAIAAWCKAHGHQVAGAPWESYFTDPNEEPDRSKWRTDITFPVAG